MIARSAFIATVISRLKQLPVNHHIDLRPYKRDRSVLIVKESEEMFLVVEEGFISRRFQVPAAKLRKTLKTLLKREFPRSRQIRLYQMGLYEN